MHGASIRFNGFKFIIVTCLPYFTSSSSSLRLWQLFGILFCCYLVGIFFRPRWCLIKSVWKVLTSDWEMQSDKIITELSNMLHFASDTKLVLKERLLGSSATSGLDKALPISSGAIAPSAKRAPKRHINTIIF